MAHVPVMVVSPRFTTQDGAGCGYRGQNGLSHRTQVCRKSGVILERDGNAALHLLLAGLSWLAAHRTAGQAETGSAEAEPIASGQTAST